MPIAARFIGLLWMASMALVIVVQGFKEAFLSAPPLLFEQGHGELYLAVASFAAGHLLWTWGRHAGAHRDI
jgi:hypothetical protein